MTKTLRLHALALVAGGLFASAAAPLSAQNSPLLAPPPGGGEDQEVEVLTRGPVHEAFAEQVNTDPQAGLSVAIAPPEDIDEMPPEDMPDGNNVQWIPGYWGWDDDRQGHIWISGLWRDVPPGQRWVPGYWTAEAGGHQWVSGFWSVEQEEELNYLPQPPATLEQGPNIAQPSAQYFWIPGCWQYVGYDWQWRPGYWAPLQDEWVWIPDRFVWTPYGYVYCAGYWDYRLPDRGVLFAPVYFANYSHWHHHHHHYTPTFTIDAGPLALHLFVRPTYCHYYFGDYYDDHYVSFGFHPWHTFHHHHAHVHHHHHYDPLLTFYVSYHHHHHGVNYHDRLSRWHIYYHDHEDHRPPHNRRELRQFLARENRGDAHDHELRANASMGRDFNEVVAEPRRGKTQFVKLSNDQREEHHRVAQDVEQVKHVRRDAEVKAAKDNVADVTIPGGPNAGNERSNRSREPKKLKVPDLAKTDRDSLTTKKSNRGNNSTRPGQDDASPLVQNEGDASDAGAGVVPPPRPGRGKDSDRGNNNDNDNNNRGKNRDVTGLDNGAPAGENVPGGDPANNNAGGNRNPRGREGTGGLNIGNDKGRNRGNENSPPGDVTLPGADPNATLPGVGTTEADPRLRNRGNENNDNNSNKNRGNQGSGGNSNRRSQPGLPGTDGNATQLPGGGDVVPFNNPPSSDPRSRSNRGNNNSSDQGGSSRGSSNGNKGNSRGDEIPNNPLKLNDGSPAGGVPFGNPGAGSSGSGNSGKSNRSRGSSGSRGNEGGALGGSPFGGNPQGGGALQGTPFGGSGEGLNQSGGSSNPSNSNRSGGTTRGRNAPSSGGIVPPESSGSDRKKKKNN